jgi:Tol biopolymer transport system component
MISGMSIRNSFLITIAVLMMQCAREPRHPNAITYPQPLPDSVAMPFLPGIVSSDSLDFNAAFSPEGKRFYFSRSSKGKWMIYVTELREGTWSKPVLAPFTETEYSQADPFITSDGKVYYISNRPQHSGDTIPDYDIWLVRPQSDGSWTKPENPEGVNSDSTEYYVSRSANGNLYFASNRTGTLGSHDIYVSRYVNGVYTTPENLGPAINSEKMEHDPMISPDEQYLIFTSVDRADTYGNGDLYYSLRNRDGTWASARNLGSKFNTDTYEYCAYLTPDHQYLFYSTNYDVKWISTRHFPWMTHSNTAK